MGNIIGYGSKTAKSHVHALHLRPDEVGKLINTARCDKRTTGIGIDDKLGPADCSCTKCAAYAEVKAAASAINIGKPKPKSKPPVEPVKVQPETKATEPEAEAGKDAAGKTDKGAEEKVSSAMETKAAGMKPAKKQEEPVEVEADSDWGLCAGTKPTSIKHIPQNIIIFEGLNDDVAVLAVKLLSAMQVQWEKGGDLPAGFIADCRALVKEAHETLDVPAKAGLLRATVKDTKRGSKKRTKKSQKTYAEIKADALKKKRKAEGKAGAKPKAKATTKRKITRRSKTEKDAAKKDKGGRVIKRRDGHPKKDRSALAEKFGRNDGSPAMTVIEMLSEGATTAELVAALVVTHKMKEKRAGTKLRAIIRKTVRKQGAEIQVIMRQDARNDYYKLLDKTE